MHRESGYPMLHKIERPIHECYLMNISMDISLSPSVENAWPALCPRSALPFMLLMLIHLITLHVWLQCLIMAKLLSFCSVAMMIEHSIHMHPHPDPFSQGEECYHSLFWVNLQWHTKNTIQTTDIDFSLLWTNFMAWFIMSGKVSTFQSCVRNKHVVFSGLCRG